MLASAVASVVTTCATVDKTSFCSKIDVKFRHGRFSSVWLEKRTGRPRMVMLPGPSRARPARQLICICQPHAMNLMTVSLHSLCQGNSARVGLVSGASAISAFTWQWGNQDGHHRVCSVDRCSLCFCHPQYQNRVPYN